MRISIRTSDHSFYGALKKENIDGVNVNICFTDSIPEIPPEHLHFVVTAATPVAIKLLSKWLYNKFKDKPDEKTLINGNKIDIETINITQITHVIRGEKEGGRSGRGTD
jgi:hypothetical protein